MKHIHKKLELTRVTSMILTEYTKTGKAKKPKHLTNL